MLRLLNKLFCIDPRSLAAFRIFAGVIVLGDLLIRFTDLSAFYTDTGVLPRSMITTSFPSVHMLSGSTEWAVFLFVIEALAAVAMIVGWHTRVATILTWYLLASLHARGMILLISGDSLLRMMIFWGMFLPLGRVWSLDARRHPAESPLRPVFSVATIALLLQTCLLYWLAGYFKYNEVWLGGLALYRTFSFEAYARPLAHTMLEYPTLLVYLGYATLVLELLGPFLLFIPWKTNFWRMLMIAAFFGLHIAIDLTMTVGLFSKVSLLAWFPFFPDVFWNKLTGRWSGVTNSHEDAPPGSLWPTGFAERLSAVICTLAFVYVLLIGYASTMLPGAKSHIMKRLAKTAYTTMIRQNFGVYARPNRNDGWCIMAARLADGQTVDLLRNGAALDWEKPECHSYIHPNHRWRTIFFEATRESNRKYRPNLCRFLAERWDRAHDDPEKILWVDLYRMDEWTPDPGEPLKHQQILLHHERIAAHGAFAEALGESNSEPDEQSPGDNLPPGL